MSPLRWIGGILLAMQALLAGAQPATDTGAAAPAAAPPALGRLFYTPQQRAAMDEERRALLARGTRPSAKPAARAKPAEAASAPPVSSTYTLQGIVRRSDGEATVWINNEAVSERMGERGIARGSLADESADLRLGENGRRVRLRVGQSVNSSSNRVAEPYQRPPAPAPTPAPVTKPAEPRD
jgi:hypothetical protein